jgi:hypothetical protein
VGCEIAWVLGQRATFLENDTELEGAHSLAASAGDTAVTTPLSCSLFPYVMPSHHEGKR